MSRRTPAVPHEHPALIPARGGSKGIPRKNIVPLAGRPLIAWTIGAPSQARGIGRVIVSTDDEEIAEPSPAPKGLRFPACARPIWRPMTPARCPSSATRSSPSSGGYHADAVIYLQPTSPFRGAGAIERAITTHGDRGAWIRW